MKCEALLCDNPRHPSLQAKKLRRQADLFEARVDQSFRVVYACDGDILQLLAVGPHQVIDQRIAAEPVPAVTREIAERRLDEVLATSQPPESVGPTIDGFGGVGAQRSEEQRAVPTLLIADLLTRCEAPKQFHARLLSCVTEDELLSRHVPEKILQRVLDQLYPPMVRQVREEPNLVVENVQDLQRYSEGHLIAFLLQLDPEQEKAVRRALDGPSMVRGGPGTGKSLVALYRVKALIERALAAGEQPPRILFTTYTNSLVQFSRQLLTGLVPEHMDNVKVSSIDRLAIEVVTKKKNTR